MALAEHPLGLLDHIERAEKIGEPGTRRCCNKVRAGLQESHRDDVGEDAGDVEMAVGQHGVGEKNERAEDGVVRTDGQNVDGDGVPIQRDVTRSGSARAETFANQVVVELRLEGPTSGSRRPSNGSDRRSVLAVGENDRRGDDRQHVGHPFGEECTQIGEIVSMAHQLEGIDQERRDVHGVDAIDGQLWAVLGRHVVPTARVQSLRSSPVVQATRVSDCWQRHGHGGGPLPHRSRCRVARQ